ncbi:HEAT repeat domain-containing protein [Kitasatospora sp. NPDC096147]|uniref:HEAT repeat domain-containing protein n=1 Tax=Kitasatospora sp. NPDC096147 TaxID=3364093 RepID=UPI00380FAE21
MIENREGTDWSSLSHAYGRADEVAHWLEQMGSPDPEVRTEGFSRFYSSALHQGTVYDSTTASVPHLFTLAGDARTPDRAAVVRLLVAIGSSALEHLTFYSEGYDPAVHGATPDSEAAAQLRERAGDFVRYSAAPDPELRRAAIPALGHFLDDGDLAMALLRDRLSAATDTAERLLVVEAAASLAGRLASALAPVTGWLGTLAADPVSDAGLRLAALVHRAECAPQTIDATLVPTAIDLLGRFPLDPGPAPAPGAPAPGAPAAATGAAACEQCTCTAEDDDQAAAAAPRPSSNPQLDAILATLDRQGQAYSPTTEPLITLHRLVDSRVSDRTALLTAQLRSADRAIRYDAIGMAHSLVRSWRGDHTGLVLLLADCLLPHDPYTTAEAATALGSLPATIAEPAREALAALVAADRATHGPDVWCARQPALRRAHQEAVTTLAGLGDERALPSLLTALDTGTDDWRALRAVGPLGRAADELLPRLLPRLAGIDFTEEWFWSDASSLIAALGDFGHPAAVPALISGLTEAIRQEQWAGARSIIHALTLIGPDAAPALATIRPLAEAADPALRLATARSLWDIAHDPAAVPLLIACIDTPEHEGATEVLARIGAQAADALPRLRHTLEASHLWPRMHAATAIQAIGGPAESETLLPTVLELWAENDVTALDVVRCLQRMGPAAAPALPLLRAELDRPERGGGFFGSIERDEELQHACRAVIARLG